MPDGDYDSAVSGPQENMEPVKNTGTAAPGEDKLAREWLEKIRKAKEKHRKAFERMRKCQQIAAFGAFKEWLDNESRYVVPVLNRHVNHAVSQLYAKNPTTVAKPRERMLYQVWDGTLEQVQQLAVMSKISPEAAQQFALLQRDIMQAQAEKNRVEKAGRTLQLVYDKQIDEQPYNFKKRIKALVRRTKVNGVGWVKMNFLREMEQRPEISSEIEDTQAKIREIERLLADVQSGDRDDEMEKEKYELETHLNDLMANQDRVVREQLIFDFPYSTEVILDPDTRELATLAGCKWLAHEFCKTGAEIKKLYGVDVEELASKETTDARAMLDETMSEQKFRFWEIQDKANRQVLVVCEGMDRFLKAPSEPDIFVERFYTLYPLVFNDIEHEEEIYPPSDVWAARHMQFEYNRSREGLREHRIAARPYYLAAKGRLEETEKERLKNHAAHEIVEVNPQDPSKPISSVLEPGPAAGIDPNLYEVSMIYEDMQRAVGVQEANLGGTSDATATETSIAEQSRVSSVSDNVDDLDELLTELARDGGIVLLQEMSIDRVKELVGQGAVWPEMQVSKRQLADEVTLSVKAGSSGRPNKAADLANLERAWPALQQLPGLNPEPIGQRYADLLDIPFDELLRSGALSIAATNAVSGSTIPAGNAPEAQGPAGSDNMDRGDPTSQQGQAPMPSGADASGLR